MSGRIKISNWRETFLGKNIYELTPQTKFLTMTGADYKADLNIEFGFRLNKIEWKFTNNANVDSYSSVVYTFSKNNESGLFLIFEKGYVNEPDMLILFGERYEYNRGILRLIFNADSTYRIHPIVTIQLLRGRR